MSPLEESGQSASCPTALKRQVSVNESDVGDTARVRSEPHVLSRKPPCFPVAACAVVSFHRSTLAYYHAPSIVLAMYVAHYPLCRHLKGFAWYRAWVVKCHPNDTFDVCFTRPPSAPSENTTPRNGAAAACEQRPEVETSSQASGSEKEWNSDDEVSWKVYGEKKPVGLYDDAAALFHARYGRKKRFDSVMLLLDAVKAAGNKALLAPTSYGSPDRSLP